MQALRAAIWGWQQVRDGKHGLKTEASPKECKDCAEDDWELFGCGFKGLDAPDGTYTDPPDLKTCPRYYTQDPTVLLIYADVEDYKRGALGNVLDLEAPYLEYLRTSVASMSAWEAKQQANLYDD
jgi:hypothetical protein